MKKLIIPFLTVLMLIVFTSCGTTKNVSVLNYNTPLNKDVTVDVFGLGQQIPNDCKLIGTISIEDSGLSTKCTYSEVINQAQNQARSMGGNIIYITKHKEPDLWSTCHRIVANVYLKK